MILNIISGKFGPGVEFSAMCIARDKQLSSDDEEILNKLCPPKSFVKVNQKNCKK